MISLKSSKATLRSFTVGIAVFVLMSSSAAYANTKYKVQATDSLSGIANKFYKNSKLSRHQIYIGLLAENPDAFRYGNINHLKSKQLLIIPKAESLLAMEKEDANSLVAEHNNHAKKRQKTQLAPPFEGYSPKSITQNINAIQRQQQSTEQEFQRLNSESEQLRLRLEQLNADKDAMDAEIRQLDELIKK